MKIFNLAFYLNFLNLKVINWTYLSHAYFSFKNTTTTLGVIH
ncbi:Uncharacterized protein XB16_2212 [Leptospira santarosai]|uniref:Uncharacterized protein n=1 Tax=Leptospira santarosai TaxID=28183 RepID=A0A2P1QUF6_9LEPT|nr:Uncharacterized protein XB16_2212 [Leptospira santarosai]AVV49253.1 Uncharacterized protein XB17_00643 [Leptospira santarosai]